MSLVSRLIGLDGGDLRRRAGLIAAGAAFVGVLVTVTTVFLALALHASLIDRFGPVQAALVVAGIGAVAAIVVAALTAAAMNRARTAVGTAVRASAFATLAPPAVSLALRHVGVTAVVAIAAAAFLAARRR
ncbi:hypothetical protein EYW49_04155 [Siculibacillus lacustris]|uniref:Uncharacterized protein n=1 Tax=Siculibacillus lacustris TaxID=1549641 RepID=A0A4Q9VWX5_9HYPH|nr:hypothetical protein [Siculibacillus lacustris]TBW40384.1 hypothetical protein EYW49_04155 [Siculibacillus lacustris]